MKKFIFLLAISSFLFSGNQILNLNFRFDKEKSELINYSVLNTDYKEVKFQAYTDKSFRINYRLNGEEKTKFFDSRLTITTDYVDENGKINFKQINKEESFVSVALPFNNEYEEYNLYRPDLKIDHKFKLPNSIKREKAREQFLLQILREEGERDKRINIVFLGDGYTVTEMDKYHSDVQNALDGVMNESPVREYSNLFNAYAIDVISQESGCKMYPTDTSPVTYFESSYNSYGIERLLVAWNTSRINSAIQDSFDGQADIIFIIVNHTKYGGSGGQFAVFSTNTSARDIAIHEMGHSYANLADEYFFRVQEKANQTSNSNPETIRWKDWVGDNNIGINQHSGQNSYKPANYSCMMEALAYNFCSVCKEHLILTHYNNIDIIEEKYPEENTISHYSGEELKFRINSNIPDNFRSVRWYLDNEMISENIDSLIIDPDTIPDLEFKIKAVIEDVNPMIRKKDYFTSYTGGQDNVISGLSKEETEWQIHKQSGITEKNKNSELLSNYPNPFNPVTTINYTVGAGLVPAQGKYTDSPLQLMVYNTTGQPVKTLVNKKQKPGSYSIKFDGSNLNSGIYYYRLKTENKIITKKMILIK